MVADDLEWTKAPKRASTWRVWFLVALGVALLAQGVVDGLTRAGDGNIYPTLAMPGFSAKNVGTDGRARTTERQIQLIDKNGGSHPVDADELLAPLGSASAAATLDRILGPNEKPPHELTPDTIAYLRQQSGRLRPELSPVGIRVEWQPSILDLRSLRNTPAGEATVREVRW